MSIRKKIKTFKAEYKAQQGSGNNLGGRKSAAGKIAGAVRQNTAAGKAGATAGKTASKAKAKAGSLKSKAKAKAGSLKKSLKSKVNSVKKKVSKSQAGKNFALGKKRAGRSTARNIAGDAATGAAAGAAFGLGGAALGVMRVRKRNSRAGTLAGKAGAASVKIGKMAKTGKKLTAKHKAAISRALKGKRRG